MLQPRTYHRWVDTADLVSFQVNLKETELFVRASKNLRRQTLKLVTKYRGMLERYIRLEPAFRTALQPVTVADTAPDIVQEMARSARQAGVGPMAAVAGAIAEFVGRELQSLSPELIIENGGDIYLSSRRERVVGIFAGSSPLTGRLGLVFKGQDAPLGICTSSGTVGHSLSYGRADAVIAVSRSTPLADAVATATGNLIINSDDVTAGIEFARGIDGLTGVVIIKGERIGFWGDLQLCETEL